MLSGGPARQTIARLQACVNAGADCLYAPGVSTHEQISALVLAEHGKFDGFADAASGKALKNMLFKDYSATDLQHYIINSCLCNLYEGYRPI